MKKSTLKDEFTSKFASNYKDFLNLTQIDDVWEFFLPHLKLKKTPVKLEIPMERIIEFNELWPAFKLPTGKYGRCSVMEMTSAFQFFFKTFPDYSDWDIIIESARIYLSEREQDKFEYTRRAKYFIRREAKDKSWESELSEYYQRINEGIQEIPREVNIGFEPRIV